MGILRQRFVSAWRVRPMLVLLAILAFVPALVGCGQTAHNGDPALPSGWTWYHDTRFPFQVPVPPGWRAGGYTVSYSGKDECQHNVDVLPPVAQYDPGASGPGPEKGPEYVNIIIPVTCPDWTLPADDPQYMLMTQSFTISGTPATLWKSESNDPPSGWDDRAAIAHFGGHEYAFIFDSQYTSDTPASGASAQLALYMQILQGFKYTSPAS
jgi:hypothetical protein